jgi:polysaccharide export outer membrane protein
MSTTAALTSATGNRIYVYGEVRKPGYYQLNGPTSVTQSIALAGGLENYADAKNILLITRDQQNRAIGRQVDINGVLSQPGVSGQTIVRQGDVVFVSKSKLGRASLIGDAIKKMIPINLSLFYNLAEQN